MPLQLKTPLHSLDAGLDIHPSHTCRHLLLLTLLATGCARPPAESEIEVEQQVAPTAQVSRISVPNEESTDEPLIWTPPSVEIEKNEGASALALAAQALADGALYENGSDAAIPLYLALRQHPEYRRVADQGLLHASQALLGAGTQLLETAENDAQVLQQVQWDAAVVRTLKPVLKELNAEAILAQSSTFLQAVDRLSQVWELNTEGERELWAGRLGEKGGGALARFRAALELMPGNERTESGLSAVETGLIWRAEQAARNDNFATADTWLKHASSVREDKTAVLEAADRIERLRNTRISRLRAQAVAGLDHYGGIQKAEGLLQQIKDIANPNDLVMTDLRERIVTAHHYGPFGPGQMFMESLLDGGHGPQMVVIAHGHFQMGARPDDPAAHSNEQPAHQVSFERGFAISIHEITVGEFARFIRASGHQTRAFRRGFSMAYDERSGNFVRQSQVDWQSDYLGNPADDQLPVLHVSAVDAAAYTTWLSAQTGAVYRLPSEAEFEYVLRAGGSGIYPWTGAAAPPDVGNLTGSGDQSPGGRTWANAFEDYADGWWGAAPIGQFAANPWGVHDLVGNVSEWVADCWHDSYRRAPGDGSAWVNPGCRNQVIRGGSWASSPAQTRASWRAPAPVDTTNARIGFRVVRVL